MGTTAQDLNNTQCSTQLSAAIETATIAYNELLSEYS